MGVFILLQLVQEGNIQSWRPFFSDTGWRGAVNELCMDFQTQAEQMMESKWQSDGWDEDCNKKGIDPATLYYYPEFDDVARRFIRSFGFTNILPFRDSLLDPAAHPDTIGMETEQYAVNAFVTFDFDENILLVATDSGDFYRCPVKEVFKEKYKLTSYHRALEKYTPQPPDLSYPEILRTSSLDHLCFIDKPDTPSFIQRRNLVTNLFTTFNHVWRHILAGKYTEKTIFRMAGAIFDMADLNITIEVDAMRVPVLYSSSEPRWYEWKEARFDRRSSHGKHRVIVAESLTDGLLCVPPIRRDRPDKPVTYLIMTVRHIMLCAVDDDQKTIFHTKPAEFLTGFAHDDMERAVEMLLVGTGNIPYLHSTIALSDEIQEIILDEVTKTRGPLEALRISALRSFNNNHSWDSAMEQANATHDESTYTFAVRQAGTKDVDSIYCWPVEETPR